MFRGCKKNIYKMNFKRKQIDTDIKYGDFEDFQDFWNEMFESEYLERQIIDEKTEDTSEFEVPQTETTDKNTNNNSHVKNYLKRKGNDKGRSLTKK